MCVWSEPGLDVSRRQALQLLGAALLAGSMPLPAASRAGIGTDDAFAAGSLEDVLRALGAVPALDSQISLQVPEHVENGAVVPVEVASRLTGPQSIFVISEANPFPLVAHFFIPEGTLPFVATRIKVARSCNVHALVQAGDRFYSAVKATNVTLGGCGA